MATTERDAGLDKLEAFISLLDAARDRIEEGGERVEAAAGALAESAHDLEQEKQRLEEMLAEHLAETGVDEEDAREGAEAVTRGGAGAMALAFIVISALTSVSAESDAGTQATAAVHNDLGEAVETLARYVEASLESLIEAAAELATSDVKDHLELLAAALVRLREAKGVLMQELLVAQSRKIGELQTKAKQLEDASATLNVVMIAITVVLIVIAIVVTVFTQGAATTLWVVVVVTIVAAIATLIQSVIASVPALLEGTEVVLRVFGFDMEADELDHLLQSDWFEWLLVIVTIVASLGGGIAIFGAAAGVAVVVMAVSMSLTIAHRVVENVARLLSALNPFD